MSGPNVKPGGKKLKIPQTVWLDAKTFAKVVERADELGLPVNVFIAEVVRIAMELEEKGVSLHDLARESAEAGQGEQGKPRASLEERLRGLEERLSFVEKFLEDVLYARAPSSPSATASTAAVATTASPSPGPSSQLEAVRPEVKELKPEPKESRKGVFKVISARWIREKRGKEPEEFAEEWRKRGLEARVLGDHVVIASDDVIEEVLEKLNELRKPVGALSEIEDKTLRDRAIALSAAGLIYYDGVRCEWRRA